MGSAAGVKCVDVREAAGLNFLIVALAGEVYVTVLHTY